MNKSSVRGCVRDNKRRSGISTLKSAIQFLVSHTNPGSQSLDTVTEDAEWAMAMSVPIRPSLVDLRGGAVGAVTARRHPTGWFIVARHHPDMSSAEIADFRHFVCVRVYLLLRHGPGPGTWAPVSPGDQWRTDLPAGTPLQGLRVPEVVPISWTNTR